MILQRFLLFLVRADSETKLVIELTVRNILKRYKKQ